MPRRKSNQQEQKQGQQWELPAGSRVWMYLRHSPGDKQTIDSQVFGMQEWCAQSGWHIVRMFIDEAQEGSKEEREHFQEMMSLAKQMPRPVDGIAVWSFSRFARSQLDAQFYKSDLRKRGYVIVSKIDEIPNNEMAPLMEAFVDWKNQRFLEDLSADVKRGQNYIVEQGYLPNGVPPTGYRIERVQMGLRHNGQVRYGNKLVKDEAMADRVALAWRMKIRDNASYVDIRKATGFYVHSSHFSGFFNNITYAGILEYRGKRYPHDWEQGGHFCEPYITLEEYFAVQEARRSRTIAVVAPRLLSSQYLLTGLIKCGLCQEIGRKGPMCGGHHDNYRFYMCISKSSDEHECALSRMPCWRLDEPVVELLRQTVLTPQFIREGVERANQLLAENHKPQDYDLDQATAEEKILKKRVESLIDLIGKKGMTPILEEQYDLANHAWQEVISRLSVLRSHPQEARRGSITIEQAEQMLDEMLLTLEQGTIAKRRDLLAQFIEKIVVYPDHADLFWKFRHDLVLLPPEMPFQVGYETLIQGTVNASLVRTAEVLKPAIARNCPSIIITHNHPSGDPTPSAEDRRVTEQLFHAAKLLDIALLDHIIIGQGRFISLREAGVGFPVG